MPTEATVKAVAPVHHVKQIHVKDWLRIGEQLFGPNRDEWKFICSSCGHSQSQTSIKAKAPSAPESVSYFNCEGRYVPKIGCDYTLGGLFRFCNVEVFRPDTRTFAGVFDFDHPGAMAEIDQALMPRRVRQTTTATTWTEWTWPEWVPEKLRADIESFWLEKWGRGPAQWLEGAAQREAPELGEEVTMLHVCSRTEKATGKFVHRWNNIGAVVRPDGTYQIVSW